MVDFIGRNGSLALFSNGVDAVVVNTDLNIVVGVGEDAVLSTVRDWESTDETFSNSVIELASGAVTTLDINVITASGRAYTIPDGVKAEAKKALEWHKEHHRGGTPVGLNTARTLAKGGQIGIEKIRHVAKYFPRHEVDKKGKGWKPGDDQFPSNGRIAWALWGGDTAWRWAKAIVERENKKSVTAGGYALPGYSDSAETYKTADAYDSDLNAFKSAHTLDPEHGPEFMARVRMDGSGVDRLYKVDFDGTVAVWDDMGWDTLGHVDGDIWSYDNALDDPYDHCEKDHFVIDPESAVYISARLQQDPFGRVSIEEMDPDEANLFSQAAADEDWSLVDYAVAASGALVAYIGSDSGSGAKPTGATKAGDGQYTAAERSNIAKGAPRDATGQFAKTGGRAVVGNDASKGAGTIIGKSASIAGNILFKPDSTGKTIDIPAKFTTPEDKVAPQAQPVNYGAPLDVSGILGEPRSPQGQTVQLPGTMEPITPQDLGQALDNWGAYVQEARDSFTGKTTDAEVRQYAKETNQRIREVPTVTEGKATSIKDGKFVVESVPAPAVTDDANPDNAPAAAAPAPNTADNMVKAQSLGKPITFNAPVSGPVATPAATPNEKLRQAKNAERTATSAKAKATSAAQEKLRKAKNADRAAEKVAPKPSEKLRNVKNAERSADSAKAKATSSAQERLRNAKNADRKAEKTPVGQSEKLRNVKNAERSADSAKAKAGADAREKMRNVKNDERRAEKTPVGQSEKLRQVKNAERSADSKKAKTEADARERLRQAKNADRKAEKTPVGQSEKLRQVKNAERSADSKKVKAEADARERLRQAKNSERATPKPGPDRPERMAPKPDAKSGKYVVKKGDSLWSIADKNKPKGESTASYWAKVMKANPKGNFKSGNPSLIYSGEKVNLPGYNSPSTPAKPTAPGKPAPKGPNEKLRQVKNAERSADSAKAKSEADAREKLRNVKNAERKAEKTPVGQSEKLRQVKNAERSADSAKAKAGADSREKMRNVKNAERKAEKTPVGQSEQLRNVKNAERSADSAKAKASSDAREKMRNVKNTERQAEKTPVGQSEQLRNVKNAERSADTAKTKAAGAAQEKLRNARNADRTETVKRGKAGARKRK